MRLRTNIIAIIAIVLIAGGAWAVSESRPSSQSALAEALDSVPADTRVAGFTDWAQIRTTLGFDKVTGKVDRDSLVANAFKRDFSSRSLLEEFTDPMSKGLGWTVADLRWEMYGQASKGAVLVAGLNNDLKSGTVTHGLRSFGYTESAGIWTVDDATLSGSIPGGPTTLHFASYLKSDRLIYFSDNRAYLESVVALHRDHGKTLAGVTSARQVAEPLTGSQSAVVSVRRDACLSTGLSKSAAGVRQQARSLLKPLGTLAPMRYGARALFDDGDKAGLRFSMTFDSASQATRQIALRKQLTTGQFVGRTGQMSDLLTLDSTHTDGPTGWLDFGFNPATASLMDGEGPLFFAACSP